MINIRRWLNETYLYNRLNNKDFFYITIIALLIIFFKFTTIIWWFTIIVILWIFNKIYSIKKKHIEEEELEVYCKKGSIDPRCAMFKNAKTNYNKLIHTITKTL
jgi:hypothetical protein